MLRSTFILGSLGAFIAPHYLWGKTQSPKEWWASASQEQKTSIRGSYDRNKAYDKGLTLGALNAIESSGGLHLFRVGENSAGLYAQRAVNVAKRLNKQARLKVPFDVLHIYAYKAVDAPTAWQISRAVQRLIQDRSFDDEHARGHLDELLRQYDGDWLDVWAAWNSQKPGQAEEVRAWTRFLMTQFK